ncbi:MAG: addiction module protein [Candidatus Dormibacteraceae bacterium]
MSRIDTNVRRALGVCRQFTHDEISRLSPGEHLNLTEQPWDSLANADPPLDAAPEAELERRRGDVRRRPRPGRDLGRSKAELARRCRSLGSSSEV